MCFFRNKRNFLLLMLTKKVNIKARIIIFLWKLNKNILNYRKYLELNLIKILFLQLWFIIKLINLQGNSKYQKCKNTITNSLISQIRNLLLTHLWIRIPFNLKEKGVVIFTMEIHDVKSIKLRNTVR